MIPTCYKNEDIVNPSWTRNNSRCFVFAHPFSLTSPWRCNMAKPAKNTICLWYDGGAEEAAWFYAKTFPDSPVARCAPGDYPSGKKGDVLTVEFTVMGVPCLGLNGGPTFKHSEAFSFQVATADQAETDRYWNAIVGNGGQESECGWCKDKWGLSWQIADRPDASGHRSRSRRGQAGVRCHDADEDRRRRDRVRAAAEEGSQ